MAVSQRHASPSTPHEQMRQMCASVIDAPLLQTNISSSLPIMGNVASPSRNSAVPVATPPCVALEPLAAPSMKPCCVLVVSLMRQTAWCHSLMGALPFAMLVVWFVPSPMKQDQLSLVLPRDSKYPGVVTFFRIARMTLSLVGRSHPPKVHSPTQRSSSHVASAQASFSVAPLKTADLAPSTKFVASRSTVPVSVRSQSVPAPHDVRLSAMALAPFVSSKSHHAMQLAE